ncbi:MAG: hypothetical protein M5U28_11320 [Sandaracinaceae bacterium]|nr:hypothetical protein [Sandaracinaceae bacterium]
MRAPLRERRHLARATTGAARAAWALALSALLVGCTESAILVVELRTDLVPERELTRVRITLDEASPRDVTARGDARYGRGERVAEYEGVALGEHTVRVSLIDDRRGAVVAERVVRVTVRSSYVLTVVVTRSCAAVTCPGSGDDPSLVSCLGGRCVDPGCVDGSAELCGPPECTTAADCAGGSSCTDAQCLEGACFYESVPERCGPGLWCSPAEGCLDDAPLDGGVRTPAARTRAARTPARTGALPTRGRARSAASCRSRSATGTPARCATTAPSCAGGERRRTARRRNHCGPQAPGDRRRAHRRRRDRRREQLHVRSRRWIGVLLGRQRLRPARQRLGDRQQHARHDRRHQRRGAAGGRPPPRLRAARHGHGAMLGPRRLRSDRRRRDHGHQPGAEEVSGETSIAQIAAGQLHTCIRRTSNAMLCFGRNFGGQLGDGTRTTRTTPTPVSISADVADMALGFSHSCALHVGGQVSCWGDNTEGEVGDGSITRRTTPVMLALSGVLSVHGSYEHSCARSATEVWCWGRNDEGQLGDSTIIDRTEPTRVVGLGAVTMLGGHAVHTCAIRATGSVDCWGGNDSGQLGDGTLVDRVTPAPVLE